MTKVVKNVVKRNQSQEGFSLIEVIIAVLIIGLSVGVIFKFQGQLIIGTFRTHTLIERLAVIKNVFVQAQEQKWYTLTEPHTIKDNTTDTTLTYTLKKFPEGSPFKNIENLCIEQVDAQWAGFLAPRTESFIAFRFVLPLPKAPS